LLHADGTGRAVVGTPTPIAGPFYTTATFNFDPAATYKPGDTWVVTIDGTPYSYLVPDLGPGVPRPMSKIAEGIAGIINDPDQNPATNDAIYKATVGGNSGALSIEYKTNPTANPFLFSVSRGGGVVKGVFDIDNSKIVTGSESVTSSFFFFSFADRVGYAV